MAKKFVVYDNPKTNCRERYEDGELTDFITATMLANKGFRAAYPRVTDWTPGKIRGNPAAAPEGVIDG